MEFELAIRGGRVLLCTCLCKVIMLYVCVCFFEQFSVFVGGFQIVSRRKAAPDFLSSFKEPLDFWTGLFAF